MDPQLTDLILRLADNALTADELRQLEQHLHDDPQAVARCADILMQRHLIRNECKQLLLSETLSQELNTSFDVDLWECMAKHEMEAPCIEIPAEEPRPVVQRRVPDDNTVRKINSAALVTALVSLAALLFLLAYPHFAPVRRAQLAGRLTRVIDAQWADTSGTLREGSDLYAGIMKLNRGLAEITLESGARVIVEAPIEFELESDALIFLKNGRLSVNVNSAANKHFIVRTPNAAVVDFGTEFGVSFIQGKTQTYVYDGEVEIRNSSNPLRFESGLALTRGQGGQVDTDGSVSPRTDFAAKFVRSDEFDTRIKASRGSAYHRWLAHSYALQRDPDLVAYYTFEKDARFPDTVANRSGLTGARLNIDLSDLPSSQRPLRTAGRWPEKAALRFDRAQRQYLVAPADPAAHLNGPVTLTAWVRCPGRYDGGHILASRMPGGGPCNYQFGYRTSPEHNAQESIHLARKINSDDWSNHVFSASQERFADWMHLVVTHDNRTLHFYINGRLVESRPWLHQQDVFSADLCIGTDGTPDDGYSFSGTMDELAVFKRALTGEEIRRLYEAGAP